MSAAAAAPTRISKPVRWTGSPWCTTVALVTTDAIALLFAVLISVGVKALVHGGIKVEPYFRLWPYLFVFLGAYAFIGLYSGVSAGAPEELRRTTITSTILFLALAAVTVSMRGGQQHFTPTLFAAILLSVVLVPLSRETLRQVCAHSAWWGYPTVIFGAGRASEILVSAMLDEPGLGLKPAAIIHEQALLTSICGVPVLSVPDFAAGLPAHDRSAYAVFVMPDIPDAKLSRAIETYAKEFSHVLLVPGITDFASLWVRPKAVGGVLGLELRQQTAGGLQRRAKRFIDLVLCLFGSVVIVPLCALIAFLIWLDSPGPIFYGQRRIGYGGEEFTAWKFRSMVMNADPILEECLRRDAILREEWNRDHKLKKDPRITRIGRFLRKASLDEFPQFWNVLMGDMSLVGPRPIVRAEVRRYGPRFDMYTRVKGGLTGLWQVSGRNDTSYEQRVYLDTFYVRNWSVWLDFCILFRTIAVVLFRQGAY